MTELKEFKLPDAGEGLTEADIVAWHVKPGDQVEDGQIIVEVETAKAVVELPSPWDGTVARLLAEEGETVEVGVPIIAIEVAGAVRRPADRSRFRPGKKPIMPNEPGFLPRLRPIAPGPISPNGRRSWSATASRPRRPRAARGRHRSPWPRPPRARRRPKYPPGQRSRPNRWSCPRNQAHPRSGRWPSRRCASWPRISASAWRELAGSGPDGSITRDDVQRAASTDTQVRSAIWKRGAGGHLPTAASPGGEERIPIRGVRKHMAAAMVSSAFTAPHVTEFLQVDVTETMTAVRRVRELPEFADLRVSPLLFVARALLIAVARHPLINSSWDAAAEEIVVKHYVNLGIAVAADRGLIVPNIKNAGTLPLPELARSLQALAETGRAGKATPADLAGGTITITNVGVFGVDAGTPILTPGEAAILAFGQVKDTPWVVDGQLAVRQACTLSLSFDHRIVDGELGSAVLRDIGSMLEDPVRMLAWTLLAGGTTPQTPRSWGKPFPPDPLGGPRRPLQVGPSGPGWSPRRRIARRPAGAAR